MSLKEAIIQARKTQGPKCPVGLLLRELPADERADLLDCLADTVTYQHSQIAAGLTDQYKVRVSQAAVMKHRNRDCSCAAI